jgi:hypothetical protein
MRPIAGKLLGSNSEVLRSQRDRLAKCWTIVLSRTSRQGYAGDHG